MRVISTIEIPGVVWHLAPGSEPREEGVCIIGDMPGALLFVDGRRVGEAYEVRPDADRIYNYARSKPVPYMVTRTVIDCMLDL